MKAEHIESIMLAYIGAHPRCIARDITIEVRKQLSPGEFCLGMARNYLRRFEVDGLIRFTRKNGGSEKHFELVPFAVREVEPEAGELPSVPVMDALTTWGFRCATP